MKAPDNILYAEKNLFKKIALVMTVPCNIFPAMLTVAGFLNIPYGYMLFPYDTILYGAFGFLYIAGLWFSFRLHKKILPLLFGVVNIAAVLYYIWFQQAGVCVVIAIIATMGSSISNQYYRTYTAGCSACTW